MRHQEEVQPQAGPFVERCWAYLLSCRLSCVGACEFACDACGDWSFVERCQYVRPCMADSPKRRPRAPGIEVDIGVLEKAAGQQMLQAAAFGVGSDADGYMQ